YGSGISVKREKLWSRFKGAGVRVPLSLDGMDGAERFLEALFGAREGDGVAPALLTSAVESAPLDAWLIEAHEALHTLCAAKGGATSAAPLTGLSYDRLRTYRDDLTRALNAKIQSG